MKKKNINCFFFLIVFVPTRDLNCRLLFLDSNTFLFNKIEDIYDIFSQANNKHELKYQHWTEQIMF